MVIVIVSLASLLIFSKKYFYTYPVISSYTWDFWQKDIFSEIRKLEKSYKWACIDNINYSNELQILDSYVRDSKLKFYNNTTNRNCSHKGTILVQNSMGSKYSNFELVKTVKALSGKNLYYIHVRPRRADLMREGE